MRNRFLNGGFAVQSRDGSVDRRPTRAICMVVAYEHRSMSFEESLLADILDRIGSSTEAWQSTMQRLSGNRLVGRFIAGSREVLRTTAKRLGVSRKANLTALPSNKDWRASQGT